MCNNSDSKDFIKKDDTTLKVGASPTPHAEILEHVQPLLKDEGINLRNRQIR
ncbi:MetQ/NlpA family ABC transporter substrate-binding protein [Enterococcus faecium]|nr:MetQ/NlpA family ABC transporter substrate-binding protein [Enterococcus faecium]